MSVIVLSVVPFFINHWRSIGGKLTLKRSRRVASVPRVPFPWSTYSTHGNTLQWVHLMKSASTFVGCRYHFSLLRPFTRRICVERTTTRPLTTPRNDGNHSRLIENSLSVWWGNWAPFNCRFVFAPVRRNNLPVLLCGWTFVVEWTARGVMTFKQFSRMMHDAHTREKTPNQNKPLGFVNRCTDMLGTNTKIANAFKPHSYEYLQVMSKVV